MKHSLLYGTNDNHLHWLTDNIAIHQEMFAAFLQMQQAAEQDNIIVHIASGWRSFDRQLHIWNNKFSGKTTIKNQRGESINTAGLTELEKIEAILLFSALPGASRHHWGTDIDVYAPNLLTNKQTLQLEPWEYQADGPFAPLSHWLTQYSQDFGFYLPYDQYRGGIASEPWHLSYLPLAKPFQQQFNLDTLSKLLNSIDIQGKKTIVDNLAMIYKKYIININPSC